MENLFLSISRQLKAQVSELRWIDMDTGQVEFVDDEGNYTIDYPAVLVDIQQIEFRDIGQRLQSGDVAISLRVCFDVWDEIHTAAGSEAPNIQNALDKFAILKKVHKCMQGFGGHIILAEETQDYLDKHFNRLNRTRLFTEKRDDALKIFNMIYECNMIDNSAVEEKDEVVINARVEVQPPQEQAVIVRNSDLSFSISFFASQQRVLELEDITFIDSDGSSRQVPACTNITAIPLPEGYNVVVHNSDDTYSETVQAPGDHELPDISFTDSDGSVSQVPACKDIVATPIPDERILIVQFPKGYDDNMTITAESDQATSWTTETLSNVATVAYEKNGVAASLPITLAEGDTLKITITRTDSEAASSVKLENS